MSTLTPDDFPAFFEEVHGYKPFPWQTMLAERVIARGWPEGVALPTASGKTACVDVAVFALALASDAAVAAPPPRRIFFVVDRRIVVDEAYERSRRVEEALHDPGNRATVRAVAERLCGISSSGTPLVVSRLRGGTVRDERWSADPTQPAVVTSTVDQVGSRLLFRGYGLGHLSQPIHAGLTACDSLILLDEAHCAVPFLQTARAVREYAGPHWSHCQTAAPVQCTVMSATLPEEVDEVFPEAGERDRALDHPDLRLRIETKKPADLAVARKPSKKDWTLGRAVTDEALVLEAAQRAADLAAAGCRRIAVMVNRVARAADIHAQLTEGLGDEQADVVLMTGRMRPVDRDQLVGRWAPFLKVKPDAEPERPIILVTTQCLEVGADFSFDALVTECASLDALRQRFGRLNRLGDPDLATTAAVLIGTKPKAEDLSEEQRDKLDDDPIYGPALEATWLWLQANSQNDQLDFASANIERLLADTPEETRRLLTAPSPDAPVMLPTHVDYLVQTAPRPAPDPDVSLFLHGPDRGMPEARVVWRCDLHADADDRTWTDTVALVPPTSTEALPVPLHRLRRWLAGQDPGPDQTGDAQGRPTDEEPVSADRPLRFLLWRGRDDSAVLRDPRQVRPEDTVLVPADPEAARRLGHGFTRLREDASLDVAERAYPEARGRAVLRICPAVLAPWRSVGPVADLLAWARDEDADRGNLDDLLVAVAEYKATEDEPSLPEWLHKAAEQCRRPERIARHPAGARVLYSRATQAAAAEDEEFADADDTTSLSTEPIPLAEHLDHVAAVAERFAEGCLPPDLAEALVLAARLHDLGKADERFQILLHGSELGALRAPEPAAKSADMPRSPSERARLRRRAALPDHFRHEMLSAQLADALETLPDDPLLRDLVLHLVASHHGHGRPFAPVCLDQRPPPVDLAEVGIEAAMTPEQRTACPPHRLDSGVAERFWRLCRHFGWWHLAYLEALLRLADRWASVEASRGRRPYRRSETQEATA